MLLGMMGIVLMLVGSFGILFRGQEAAGWALLMIGYFAVLLYFK